MAVSTQSRSALESLSAQGKELQVRQLHAIRVRPMHVQDVQTESSVSAANVVKPSRRHTAVHSVCRALSVKAPHQALCMPLF